LACESEPARPLGTELVTEPTLFAPGVISTGENEYRVAFSTDGREAYFTRSSGGRGGRPRVFMSRVQDGGWSEPELASFSTGWEEAPFLTSDGYRLIFSSRRDVPGWGPVPGNDNLWMVERGPDGWSEPVPLPGEVNKPRVGGRGSPTRSESGAVLLSDGTLLYSTQEEPERGQDIYVADQVDGRFVDVRPMLLNTSGDEAGPALSPDGRLLVFHGLRDPYDESDDLFLSERTAYGWSTPERLPEPINTPTADEQWASFSPDGQLLFFSSDRGRGGMSIYYVGVQALGIPSSPIRAADQPQTSKNSTGSDSPSVDPLVR
jgi:Tol biopolymer transport system component